MSEGALEKGCGLIGSKIYAFGGFKSLETVSKRVEYYDFDSNEWHDAPDLPINAAETHMAYTQVFFYLVLTILKFPIKFFKIFWESLIVSGRSYSASVLEIHFLAKKYKNIIFLLVISQSFQK